MSKIKINGVAVATPAVAVNAPDAKTGEGNWYFNIGTVRGDVRAKSSIAISGIIDETVVVTVNDAAVMLTDDDDRTQCNLQDATQWKYDPASRSTLVGYDCTNYQSVAKTVDLSNLTLTYSLDSTNFGNFRAKSGVNAVKLPKGTAASNPVSVVVFKVPGDIRSGGLRIKITGNIDYN